MKVVVCIKQVPLASRITFDPERRTIVREGVPLEVNSYDLLAVQAAASLVRGVGGEVVALTMGPPQAREALVQCLALGADRAVHLVDRAFAGSDTLATSRALALALRREGYDLILCGKHSTDAETGQVGPEVAELLGLPLITGVRRLEVDPEGRHLWAERETEEGFEEVEAPLPALVTVGEGVAPERWPSREALREASSRPIEALTAADLSPDPSLFGFAGSPTWVAGIEHLEVKRTPRLFEGPPDEVVGGLVEALLERGLFREGGRREEGPLPRPPGPRKPGKALWVVAEADVRGRLRPVTRELLGKADALARGTEGEVAAVLMGSGVGGLVEALGASGADRVYLAEHPAFGEPAPGPAVRLLAGLVERERPFALLFPSTLWGREVASRLAARLGVGLTGDCVDLGLDEEGRLVQYKPAFGGTFVCPILSRTFPQMATVRPGLFPLPRPDPSRRPVVERVPLGPEALGTSGVRVLARRPLEAAEAARLYEADVVVGIGVGVGGPENLAPLFRLAEALGAAVCATRGVTDRGWLPKQFQVGLTGKAIAPRFYFAIGVSGALNHLVGVLQAGTIVAINKNPRAPIFRACDLGVVGDWGEVVPLLTGALERARPR